MSTRVLPSWGSRAVRALATLSAVVAAACGDAVTTPIPIPEPLARTTVRVTPRTAFVDQLDTLRFRATVTDADGRERPGVAVTWSTDAPGVLQIDGVGLARAGAATGSVTVIASAGGGADTVRVTVRLPVAPSVWPDTNALLPGMSRALAVRKWDPDYGVLTPLAGAAWTSSDPSVARVDSAGVVVAVTPGVATVTATLPTGHASAVVHVPAYATPLRFTAVAPGTLYTCALTGAGAAYCWGEAASALATNAYTDRCEAFSTDLSAKTPQPKARGTYRCAAIPLPVERAPSFASLVPGAPCALTADGTAFCWGVDYTGEHNGAPLRLATPTAVPGLAPLQSGAGLCGVTRAGEAFCWGSTSTGARPGASPLGTPPAGRWASVALGGIHACGLTTDGVVACRGRNDIGQLGVGAVPQAGCDAGNTFCTAFAPTATEERFVEVGAGTDASCGRRADGQVFCWGYALNAGLPSNATGSAPYWPAPTALALPEPLVSLSMAGRQTCGLGAGGAAYCWGLDVGAQLPAPYVPTLRFRRIAAGGYHVCGIATDGLAYCRGGPSAVALGGGQLTWSASLPIGSLTRIVGQ